MLSREDFYMIKQMRQQGAYIVDIVTQIGCSERTVRRYLKYPEPPARRTRHKMVKLKPFMDYIDMRLAENVWNSAVIFAEIKAMGYTGGRSMLRYYIQPNRKMRPSKRTVRFETQPGYQLQHDWGEVEVEVAGQRCKVNFAVNALGFSRRFHVFAELPGVPVHGATAGMERQASARYGVQAEAGSSAVGQNAGAVRLYLPAGHLP